MSLVGLLLAAGESRRMGRPKALLPLGSTTMLERGVVLLGSQCDAVVVVEGAHSLGGLASVTKISNPNWRVGALSSLQTGLRAALAIDPDLRGVLVHQVDRPRVRESSVAELRARFVGESAIWQPRHRGVSGHPILWPREALEDLLALDPDRDTPRALLSRPRWSRVRRFMEVDDPGVLDNIDTPADYEHLCETLGVVPWSTA